MSSKTFKTKEDDIATDIKKDKDGRSKSSISRFRIPEKQPVPKLHSSELTDRVNQYPLSKNELVEYLIRL